MAQTTSPISLADTAGPLTLVKTIPVPGTPLTSFDISWIDPTTELYFLADRSNASVDIFDAANRAFLGRVAGFTGFSAATGTSVAGPDGVVSTGPGTVWAGNGDSTVKVIDVRSLSIVDSISTGGKKRVDEMAFDGRDGLLLAANNADSPPFATLFDTTTRKIVKSNITVPNVPADGSLEQPAFDPATNLFYISVPQVGSAANNGGVAIIDTKGNFVDLIPISDCEPSGLAIGPDSRAVVGCGLQETVIINLRDKSIVATITDVGGADEVWFNAGDRSYYISGRNNVTDGHPNPILGVINAETNTFLGGARTEVGAHSVAANARTREVFVPIDAGTVTDQGCQNGCIAIYKLDIGALDGLVANNNVAR